MAGQIHNYQTTTELPAGTKKGWLDRYITIRRRRNFQQKESMVGQIDNYQKTPELPAGTKKVWLDRYITIRRQRSFQQKQKYGWTDT